MQTTLTPPEPALATDRLDLSRIAQDLQIRKVQVESVVQLLDEGNTIPFITRYRKERTGGLDEEVLRTIKARVDQMRALAERKQTVLKSIEGQGKLTDELRNAVLAAETPKRLEDLYLPFKPKKRTLATAAREKGLEPLAQAIWSRDPAVGNLAEVLPTMVNPEKELNTPEDVLLGVRHILAEQVAETADVRAAVRFYLWDHAKLVTGKGEKVKDGEGLDFKDYFQFEEAIRTVPPHRILAINRGEKEHVLQAKLDFDREMVRRIALDKLPLADHPHAEFLQTVAEDALGRLLLPSLENEIRRELRIHAEEHAVRVFARNLRSLLLAPPLRGKRVLAIDPAFRTGCKLAALDEFGNILEDGVVFPHQPQNKKQEARLRLEQLIRKHQLSVIAIGNGTACRETEELVADVIAAAEARWGQETGDRGQETEDRGQRTEDRGQRTEAGEAHIEQPAAAEAVSPSAAEEQPAWTRETPGGEQVQPPPAAEQSAPVAETPPPPPEMPAPVAEAAADQPEQAPPPEGEQTAQPAEQPGPSAETPPAAPEAPAPKAEPPAPAISLEGLPEAPADLAYIIVSEAGASVYSASPVGREEFPEFDATLRGTISIGRRLQDPLSELVKIDPQHVGVGLYQHDVQERRLKESLEGVIESCVNSVGVDLNTASVPLLRHVSGMNQLVARDLIEFRKSHGPFKSREQLTQVPGIGEARYTQAAGFLKIVGGDEPLDQTWIHPESYAAARQLLGEMGYGSDVLTDRQRLGELREKLKGVSPEEVAARLNIGTPTCQDILDALARPGRDPREDLPPPVFKKGILKLEDLQPGMELKGTVLNVVDFGAFVDIGLKDSGLVHISQMANRYVKSPYDVVSVGDVVNVWVLSVDKDRRRVSLTMIKPGTERRPQERRPPRGEAREQGGPPRDERHPPRRGGPPAQQQRRGGPPPGQRRGAPPGQRPQPQQARGARGEAAVGQQQQPPPPRKPRRPTPKPQLSQSALSGTTPLGTFAELAAFWEAKKTTDEPTPAPAPPPEQQQQEQPPAEGQQPPGA